MVNALWEVISYLRERMLAGDEEFYKMSEIAKAAGITYKSVRNACIKLEGSGLIQGRVKGPLNNWGRAYRWREDHAQE